tara:strand:+ start:166 stop:282 length:117 start_codon:yes stop_codon:yes gene_type:complete
MIKSNVSTFATLQAVYKRHEQKKDKKKLIEKPQFTTSK